MCGGTLLILPCSHVGHIFRKASPHDFPKGANSGKILNANLIRVSETWLDEQKHLFYKTAPRKLKLLHISECTQCALVTEAIALRDTIDVSDRIELRKKLKCHSFSWCKLDLVETVLVCQNIYTPMAG